MSSKETTDLPARVKRLEAEIAKTIKHIEKLEAEIAEAVKYGDTTMLARFYAGGYLTAVGEALVVKNEPERKVNGEWQKWNIERPSKK